MPWRRSALAADASMHCYTRQLSVFTRLRAALSAQGRAPVCGDACSTQGWGLLPQQQEDV